MRKQQRWKTRRNKTNQKPSRGFRVKSLRRCDPLLHVRRVGRLALGGRRSPATSTTAHFHRSAKPLVRLEATLKTKIGVENPGSGVVADKYQIESKRVRVCKILLL